MHDAADENDLGDKYTWKGKCFTVKECTCCNSCNVMSNNKGLIFPFRQYVTCGKMCEMQDFYFLCRPSEKTLTSHKIIINSPWSYIAHDEKALIPILGSSEPRIRIIYA